MTETPGLVVVDKPQGWTSHQVVARLRRLLGTRRVGHAGTLDPMATGILLVGVNRATRLLGHLAGQSKTYTATIRLGQSTTTDDAEGEIVTAVGAMNLELAAVETVLSGLRGRIQQVPSAVSAIKVNGKRAYARVRAGEQVQLAAREVTVDRFELLESRAVSPAGSGEQDQLELCDLDVVVDCSSGTYIRALARDLGERLGCGGHLTALRRTRIGNFGLDLVKVGEAELAADQAPEMMELVAAARRAFPVIEVEPAQAKDIGYGRPIKAELPADPTALVFADRLLALYRPATDGEATPVAVFV